MEISQIINMAERYDYTFHEYEEKGVLCGYEMETWTDGGVNMIHFIDCRESNYEDGLTAQNVLEELEAISGTFNVDHEIELHREGKDYCKAFTIRESLEDFEAYQERLTAFVRAVVAAFYA